MFTRCFVDQPTPFVGMGKLAKQIIVIFIIGFYFGAYQMESSLYNFLPNLDFGAWDNKTFYNTIGGILITAAVIKGFGAKIFESRIAQFLGKISFSIYLLHFIILCSLSSFLYIHFPQNNLFLMVNFCVYILVAFISAAIFEKFIDRKAINISHKFSSKIFS